MTISGMIVSRVRFLKEAEPLRSFLRLAGPGAAFNRVYRKTTFSLRDVFKWLWGK